MALSMKAAMMICASSIAGMSWLLQYASVGRQEMPSPLVAGVVVAAGNAAAGADEWERPVEPVGWRSEWAERFERPSPVQEVAAAEAESPPTLSLPLPLELASAERYQPLPVAGPGWPVDAGVGEFAVAAAEPGGSDERPVRAGVDAADEGAVAEGPALEPASPAFKAYRVARGETLTRIAERQCGAGDPRLVRLLMQLNPKVGRRNGRVQAGEELLLPDTPTAQRMLAALAEAGNDPARVVAAMRPTAGDAETGSAQWYTIQRNDSLTRIAERFLNDGGRWREILKLNRSLDPDRLFPGTRIKLPAASVART